MTRLQEEILKSGLKKKYIAKRCGKKPETVGRWAKGTLRPGDDSKKILAELLGVMVGYLFYDEAADPTDSVETVA